MKKACSLKNICWFGALFILVGCGSGEIIPMTPGLIMSDAGLEPDGLSPISTPLPDAAAPLEEAPVQWTVTDNEGMGQINALYAKNGSLAVSAEKGLFLYQLADEALEKKCGFTGDEVTAIQDPAVIDTDGNLYFNQQADKCLVSVDSDCKKRWQLDCQAPSASAPQLVPGKDQLVIATKPDKDMVTRVLWVQTQSGTSTNSYELTEGTVDGSLAVASGEKVFLGVNVQGKGHLYLFAPDETQTIAEPTEIFSAAEFKAPAVVMSSRFYVGDSQDTFYHWTHSSKEGWQQKWTNTTSGKVYREPTLDQNVLLIMSVAEYGLVTMRTNGGPSWELPLPGIQYSGAAVDKNRTIYVGSSLDCDGGEQGGCLYAVRSDGTLRWKYQTSSPINATPFVYKNVVIVGDEGGNLYGFSVTDEGE